MPRPKKDILKDHITATIDPCYSRAIVIYQRDRKNQIKGKRPTRSQIIQGALQEFLKHYFKTESINKTVSNNAIVAMVDDQ